MSTSEFLEEIDEIPTPVYFAAVSLIIVGLLAVGSTALLLSFGYWGFNSDIGEGLLGFVVGLATLATGVSMLLNHKSALHLSLLVVVMLTIDTLSQFLADHHLEWSLDFVSRALHVIAGIILYWVAYFTYRRWRSNFHKL